MTLHPHHADDLVTLYHGDCIEVMRALPDSSVDAVVTDPPYGLEFMGKEWDSFRVDDPGTMRHRGDRADDHGETDADRGAFGNIAYGGGKRATTNRCVSCGKRDQFRNEHACGPDAQWRKEIIDPHAAPPTSLAFQEWARTWALEALRVLKPGGHLLAFGGTRTWHRLACAIEDAGFEVRDSIAWMYGSGFPKSLDVSKAIDKAAGATREPSGAYTSTQCDYIQRGEACPGHGDESSLSSTVIHSLPTAPATPEAKTWQGWGTALKPAFEPIVVARKPLSGTVAANVLRYGTGALNVAACRVPSTPGQRPTLDAWVNEPSRCPSCAAPVEQSARPTTRATRASTATRSAAPTSSARDATSPAATSKTATGSSDGTRAVDSSTSSSTGASGKKPTGRSLTDTSSITSTTTDSTTDSTTCNSCGAAITSPITSDAPTSTPMGQEPRPTTNGSTAAASAGRWPSNVILDESQARALDAMSGVTSSGSRKAGDYGLMGYMGADVAPMPEVTGDTGGASRFFYTAKADSSERPRVRASGSTGRVAGTPARTGRECNVCGNRTVPPGGSPWPACGHEDWSAFATEDKSGDYIAHPTVKPLTLMRYLVRLVTPPGGVVLEPFAGSGTTLEACIVEGFRCIGIEREPDYLPLIMQRITKPIEVTLL